MPEPTTPPAQATPTASTPPAATPPATPPAAPAVPETPSAQPAAPAAKVAPEKYDLKLPEGSKLEASHLERIASFAKERGLSNEDAQAIVERDHANLAAYDATQQKTYKDTVDGWIPLAKADPEIGGEAFPKNVELAKRVVDRVTTPEMKKFLEDSGFGNHPEVIRTFYRLGKMMSEDQLVIPGSQQPSEKKSAEDYLYPNQNKKEN